MNILIFLHIVFYATFLFAQQADFSGEWVGKLYQEAGGVSPEYNFQMSLIQQGDRVKGATYIELPNMKDVFATIKLRGTVKGNQLFFEEYQIMKEKTLPNMQYCLKKGTLTFSIAEDKCQLKGSWTGYSNFGPCVPGTIIVFKPYVKPPEPVVIQPKKDLPKNEPIPIVQNAQNTVKDTLVDLPIELKKGQKIVLSHVYFKPSSWELLPSSYPELEKVYHYLRSIPSLSIQIQGHTDIGSTPDYNQRLSENRAKAVADWLIKKGIKAERISYKGFGNTKPIADNNTPEGRAKNRRIEFEVINE
ncbi:MAG: OmpA family protein [Bacteroidia bacterium]|nr:OmpA family protein [Bacteroidia bacterium]MDW8347724.1 OmpA family protein [Bacteroidia bacterium]